MTVCSFAYDARERGADIVKKWDSTLDGLTRESHRAVDGELRELDEKFSNGLMYPGDPAGGAAEVVNCRCALLQKARKFFEGSFTKMNNFTKQLETFEGPEDYNEFKKAFFSKENEGYMNYINELQERYKTRDFKKVLDRMSEQEYKHYSKLLKNNPVFNKKGIVDKSSESGIIKTQEVHCYGDYLRDKLGSALENNLIEYESIKNHITKKGGKLILLDNNSKMICNIRKGAPGIIEVDKNISIGGLRHEYRHFLDDLENGCPGLGYYLKDKDRFFEFERRGYEEELRIAKEFGYFDVVKKIEEEIEHRKSEIYGY